VALGYVKAKGEPALRHKIPDGDPGRPATDTSMVSWPVLN